MIALLTCIIQHPLRGSVCIRLSDEGVGVQHSENERDTNDNDETAQLMKSSMTK